MNIYVGNLSYQTDEQSLGDRFAEFGEVTRVHIVTDRETGRPRGFGFVEMPDESQARKAIDAVNGTESGGRTLTVNEARPREDRGFGRGPYGGGGGGGYGGGGGGGGGYGGGGGLARHGEDECDRRKGGSLPDSLAFSLVCADSFV